MTTDAIVLVKDDHKEIKRVFREFEKAEQPAEKGRLVARMAELLTVHTYIENECMYPEVRQLMSELEADVLESYEEHHVADLLVDELSRLDPSDEHFQAKTTVLIENVEHHMSDEEDEWFPKVRDGLSRTQVQEIGAKMLELKKDAPRSPDDARARKTQRHAVQA